jgi:FkbM family methyltransferase
VAPCNKTEMTAISQISTELEKLLGEPLGESVARESQAFDLASRPFEGSVILHGAGRFGRRTLKRMRSVGLEPIAFSDNDPKLDGKHVDGIPVFSALKAAEFYGKSAAFAVTVWNAAATDRMRQRIQLLEEMGCQRVFPVGLLCWKYPDAFLPYYPLDLPHKVLESAEDVDAAYQLFSDEESRREYVGQARFRLWLDYDALGAARGADYFSRSELFDLRPDEVFIDCGAFDGDTIEDFVRARDESFQSIHAFEPDPLNWPKLQDRLSRLPSAIGTKIKALPYALGSKECVVQFDSTGQDTARIGEGTISVECVPLDHVLAGISPTFIKFDIEGAELDALEGAREVIERCRPVLAVSCYHQQNHLWEVPLKLKELCRDYQFFLRPHGSEGWDLLCYGIPTERVKLH